MATFLIHHRIAQCGATVREIADLLGIHPHHLDGDSFRHLPGLPTRVLVELARRLDLHLADLVPDLNAVLTHPRQAPGPAREEAPGVQEDAGLVLAALAHAGTPLHTYALYSTLEWPQHRLQAALDHLQDHPGLAEPMALRRTGAHTFALGVRMDVLTAEQRAALDSAGGRTHPIGEKDAAVLAALLGFGPAPQGRAWKAGADGLGGGGAGRRYCRGRVRR